MGAKTGIQWTDTTVNPTTGCDGCELWAMLHADDDDETVGGPCYAGNLHEGRLALAMPKLYGKKFTEVRVAPGRMMKAARLPDLRGQARPDKPWLDGMPRLIFVGDMGDVLSINVPLEYLIDEVIGAITSPQGSRHIWQILTKRPNRLAMLAQELADRGIDWPENIWSGTSVTSAAQLKRVDALLRVPGMRFLSLEPLWGPIDLTPWLRLCNASLVTTDGVYDEAKHGRSNDARAFERPEAWAIHQVIIGGQSDQPGHPAKPTNLAWVRSLLSQCDEAGVPAFLKQWGSHPVAHRSEVYDLLESLECEAPTHREDPWPIHLKDSHGGDWNEWPAEYRVRRLPKPKGTLACR